MCDLCLLHSFQDAEIGSRFQTKVPFQVMMCLIGEGWGSPEHGSEVNGAVISMRGERNSKLGVWLADCENVS